MNDYNIITNVKINDILQEHLQSVNIKKKNKQGETFTPIDLIIEMLNTLPANVWSNIKLKWLDPACGLGIFGIIIYYKLMNGLKRKIPNETQRSKHIIENMIYNIDIDEYNISVCKKLFKLLDASARPNIKQMNFLEKDLNEKFDIIVGNPPYNKGGIRSRLEGKSKKEVETLWTLFVRKSFDLMKDNKSLLLFITPASWISLQHGISHEMLSKQILYIKYYNYIQSYHLFGDESAKIPLTYYLIQNVDTKENSLIYDNCLGKELEFNIYKNNFIPSQAVGLFKKLLRLVGKYGSLKDKYYNSVRPEKTLMRAKPSKNYKYPLLLISYDEINVKYYKENLSKNGNKKLIFPNFSMGYPLYDYEGNWYPASNMMYILESNNDSFELKQLQDYFYCNTILFIINCLKTKQNFFNNKIFEIIPDITKMTSKENIDDELLYKLFGLGVNDIKCIEHYKNTGEGRLSATKIKEFKNFKL